MSVGPEVLVVRTGTANLASVLAALRRLGARPELTEDPQRVARAERVVLPGVGAFAAALETLRAHGLDEAVRARIEEVRPTLAICLGLQVLCEGSEESPGIEGLGLVPGYVQRFTGDLRIPQLGWNQVVPLPSSRLITLGYAYYANSYHVPELPEGWTGATTDHGGSFVAALERGPILACQFHPELSGTWGSDLLKRWLDQPVEGAPC